MRVANRKCIRHLSIQSMKAAKTRNRIAIMAIVLTTVLFTSLFTITMSIVYGFEQSNFRQAGGWCHGSFKKMSKEQFDELKTDSAIEEYGLVRFVGVPNKSPFQKQPVEVKFCDANAAKWSFFEPVEGHLPEEGTMEAAADTQVLALLGVEPKIGEQFTLTFDVDGTETTETFTLCGWWEQDDALGVSFVLTPQSRAEEIYEKLGTQALDGMTGKYEMYVMLKSKANIGKDMEEILQRHGYQSENVTDTDTYVGVGVNWGYLSAQLSDSMDAGVVMGIAVILILIIFTGYLIIYNVFQISVYNDIRFYGLLKTVGTTGRQLKSIVFFQSMFLSLVGIPVGLALGYGTGAALTPIVTSVLNGVEMELSGSPVIFAGAALFSLITVAISCYKPSGMAAKVSPIEAVRYTEGAGQGASRRKLRRQLKRAEKEEVGTAKEPVQGQKGRKGASIFRMAWANMGRSRSRTVITILSMSLAVILLNLTFTFTQGFDMDKYLNKRVNTDFVAGNVDYFIPGRGIFYEGMEVEEEFISQIEAQGGILSGGRTYGMDSVMYEYVTEEHYRQTNGKHNSQEVVETLLKTQERWNGLVADNIFLYGMEKFCLDSIKVFEGDISKLYGEGNYIAAVYHTDDFSNVMMDSNWAKPGDKMMIRYAEEMEYYNPVTGEVYESEEIPENQPVRGRASVYHDVEYEVAALVTIPNSLSYRYGGRDEFVLNAGVFKRDTDTDSVMYYAFNMENEEAVEAMEGFMADYTERIMPDYDYESKLTYEMQFESLRGMFRIMGSALSFIVGLVGVLNFLNAVLTGIMARRREFAVLQSVGMTGGQLKRMLVIEGMIYALGAVVGSLVLSIATAPALSSVLGSVFWFFSYHFTVVPVLAVAPFFVGLGFLLPLLTYRMAARKSVVERLREVE